jgi:hypothetical protein
MHRLHVGIEEQSHSQKEAQAYWEGNLRSAATVQFPRVAEMKGGHVYTGDLDDRKLIAPSRFQHCDLRT